MTELPRPSLFGFQIFLGEKSKDEQPLPFVSSYKVKFLSFFPNLRYKQFHLLEGMTTFFCSFLFISLLEIKLNAMRCTSSLQLSSTISHTKISISLPFPSYLIFISQIYPHIPFYFNA